MNQHTGNIYAEMDKKKRHYASADRGDANWGGANLLPDIRGLDKFPEPVQSGNIIYQRGQ